MAAVIPLNKYEFVAGREGPRVGATRARLENSRKINLMKGKGLLSNGGPPYI